MYAKQKTKMIFWGTFFQDTPTDTSRYEQYWQVNYSARQQYCPTWGMFGVSFQSYCSNDTKSGQKDHFRYYCIFAHQHWQVDLRCTAKINPLAPAGSIRPPTSPPSRLRLLPLPSSTILTLKLIQSHTIIIEVHLQTSSLIQISHFIKNASQSC